MLRSVLTVASALVLLALGAMTAAADNRHAHSGPQAAGATHAGAITALTTGAMSEVKAVDDQKAQEAAPAVPAAPDAAQAQADPQAEVVQPQIAQQGTDEEEDDADEGEGSD